MHFLIWRGLFFNNTMRRDIFPGAMLRDLRRIKIGNVLVCQAVGDFDINYCILGMHLQQIEELNK